MDTGSHQFRAEGKEASAQIHPMEFPLAPPAASVTHSNAPLPPAFTSESENRIRALEAEVAALRGSSSTFASDRVPAASEQEAFEAGRAAGLSEREQARQRRLEAMAAQIEEAITNFRRSEESYLHRVEQEVVRLSLAVAARILRHEAEADPLLLSGAVRVALGQLSETAEVRLRVPMQEESLWQEMVRLTPNLAHRPAIEADASMQAGECILESSMGTIDLGLASQLEEIKSSFFEHSEDASAEASVRVERVERSDPKRRRRTVPADERIIERTTPEEEKQPALHQSEGIYLSKQTPAESASEPAPRAFR